MHCSAMMPIRSRCASAWFAENLPNRSTTAAVVCHKIVTCLSAFAFLPLSALPSRPPPIRGTADELIRRVVANELASEEWDHSHWMFRLETATKNGQQEVDEVVETKNGDLKIPIIINGRGVTAKQREEGAKRLEQLVHNPEALRKSANDKNQDAARSQQLLRILPDAFIFNLGERHGNLQQLVFKPNPHFQPRNREAEVFHAMEGTVWVDDTQNRFAEISGRLMEEVKFGGGLLGHLDKGGTFDVKQEPIAKGYWEMTLLQVEMNGKALFFKTITVRQKISRSEFKRVPDDLTVAQGVDLLKKQIGSFQMPNSARGVIGSTRLFPERCGQVFMISG